MSIAKWLAAEAEILIIDEPTVGIDIKTKTYLHELIGRIARDGVSILLISSDMPEMITLADRILVMHDFRIVGEVANDHRYETTSKAIMSRIHALSDAGERGRRLRRREGAAREDAMATIESIEIRMVDLKPKVKRIDAIQSFVSQETPIVRIADADGAVGVGYCYTIGDRRSLGRRAARPHRSRRR